MSPSQRDHEQFLQLIARLRAVAEKHGDRVFASALGDCLTLAAGADSGCPMADLIVQDCGDGPHSPAAGAKRPHRIRPLVSADPPPYDRGHLLGYVYHALEERAILKGDTPYVAAIHSCQKSMLESDACPMHRLLKQHDP